MSGQQHMGRPSGWSGAGARGGEGMTPAAGSGRGARAGPCGSAGFSLVEVLVSVAVVATLMGVLLPAIGSVRRAARGAVCGSNLRQLVAGVQGYAADQRGLAPPGAANFLANLHRWHGTRASEGEAFVPGTGPISVYLGEAVSTIGGDGAGGGTNITGLGRGAGRAAGVRRCPEHVLSDGVSPESAFEAGAGGYGYNQAFLGAVRRSVPGDRVGAVERWPLVTDRTGSSIDWFARPAETIAFADAALHVAPGLGGVIEYSFAEPPEWPDRPGEGSRPDPSIHFRHGVTGGESASGAVLGVAQHGFMDGHVRNLTRAGTHASGIYSVPINSLRTGWGQTAETLASWYYH